MSLAPAYLADMTETLGALPDVPDSLDMPDPTFEDRAYPTMPGAFRSWARISRASIRTALSSDLGRTHRSQQKGRE